MKVADLKIHERDLAHGPLASNYPVPLGTTKPPCLGTLL